MDSDSLQVFWKELGKQFGRAPSVEAVEAKNAWLSLQKEAVVANENRELSDILRLKVKHAREMYQAIKKRDIAAGMKHTQVRFTVSIDLLFLCDNDYSQAPSQSTCPVV